MRNHPQQEVTQHCLAQNGSFQLKKISISNTEEQFKCFNCGKEGHSKRDCRAERNQNNLQHYAKVVEVEESEKLGGTFTTLVDEKMQIKGVWIIDSGATSHITWDRSLLENYMAFTSPEEVRLGD